MRLKHKVAIVTGGAQGIGRSYVTGFANEGAKCVVADINVEAANETMIELKNRGADILTVVTDVSDVDSTLDMARKTVEQFGRIDILLNNAAILGRVKISRVPFYELDLAEWDRVMAVNVKGAFLCARAVFPYMKEQGSGKIINISSSQFFVGGGGVRYAHYVASKGAIIGLTRILAREMGDYNINVNCIAPGSTFSEDPSDKASFEIRSRAIPLRAIKRVEYPEDLIGTAVFLASSDSDFISGQTIVVDGGDVMY